jgi:membrane-associated protein
VGSLLDPQHLITTFGLLGLLAIVFAECGLLIGFFLPGDSLLFVAGLVASGGLAGVHFVPLWVLLIVVPLAAIAGNLVGYWIGYRAGPAIFNRPNSRLFRAEYVEKAHDFFEKYGARTILLARFVPIVRTFATVMAGASRMNFRLFAIYSVIGGIVWGAGVTALGYWLGQVVWIRDNIELIAIGIVVVTVIPVVFELMRGRRRNAAGRGQTTADRSDDPAPQPSQAPGEALQQGL